MKQAIDKARKTQSHYSRSGSQKIGNWQRDLLNEIGQGWTGHGQTNGLLQSIACYGVVFQGLSEIALIDFVEQTAINSPGYGKWCGHQHEIRQRARDQAAAAERYYWALGSSPKRPRQEDGINSSTQNNNIVSFNRRQAEDAQARIRQAVADLKNKGELPEGVTARMKAVVVQANSSATTLQKYKTPWHPRYV